VAALMKELHTMKETFLSLVKMDATLVLAPPDKLLVLITHVAALMEKTHIMKEILSLAKMDATIVLAPLEKLLVLIAHVAALMKETHIMKETLLSHVKMDVILVPAPQEK